MLMKLFWLALLAAGYAAAIYTWPTLRGWARGVDAEIAALRADLDKLRSR